MFLFSDEAPLVSAVTPLISQFLTYSFKYISFTKGSAIKSLCRQSGNSENSYLVCHSKCCRKYMSTRVKDTRADSLFGRCLS